MKKKENPTAGIEGFLKKPKHSAGGRIYRGRFTFPGIQWTGDGADALVTFTITAEELADIAESRLLWTDQDVQRGIRPEIAPQRPLVNCLLARAIRTHAVTYSMLRTRMTLRKNSCAVISCSFRLSSGTCVPEASRRFGTLSRQRSISTKGKYIYRIRTTASRQSEKQSSPTAKLRRVIPKIFAKQAIQSRALLPVKTGRRQLFL